ncbi:MAG TPA: type 4a pilus biogenesis protein PilO [Clostridiaceae bacterium]
MKNLSKSDQLVLAGIGILFLLFLYYQFLINPALTKISDLNQQITNKKQTVEDITNMEIVNTKLKKKIVELKTKYETSKKLLPSELRDPEIENDLNKVAISNKVTMSSMSFGSSSDYNPGAVVATNVNSKSASTQNGKLMLVPVSMSIMGQYKDIMNYIVALEKADRISEVENISIYKSGINSSINVGLVVNYYFVSSNDNSQSITYAITPPTTSKADLFN